MYKQHPEIKALTLRELCEAMMETEEYPARDGVAKEVARKVYEKDSPVDVEIIRVGKMCAMELARRFLTQQTPRWMIIKYYRKSADRDYFPSAHYTHYKKERAEDQLSYLEAQLPFERNDVYYELVLTYDYQQDWQKIREIRKLEPKTNKKQH